MSMDLQMTPSDAYPQLFDAPVTPEPAPALFAGYSTDSASPAISYKTHDASAAKLTAATSVLKNFTWQSTASETEASNATEEALLALIDAQLCVSSVANVPRLLDLLTSAKTEPERALVLVILRSTALATDVKLAKASIAAFEKRGGLRLAKRWLEEAIEWNHTDLLVLLLDVLKALPLQLPSITQAKINEPIVNLRKSAREEKVRRSAQDLLKFWRNKFTEKAKAQAAAAAAPVATPTTKSVVSSTPLLSTSSSSSAASASATVTATGMSAVSGGPASSSSSSSSSAGKGESSPPTKLTPAKRRTIKRLERLPFGGGAAVSKSSDLIGNLMQRKSAKDAAAAAEAAAAAKVKSETLVPKATAKETKSESRVSSTGPLSKSPPPAVTEPTEFAMALPTIQSFNAVTATVTKKIRWADEAGQELVKVKLIESWRDLILHDPNQSDESFSDAKLREHANERNAMKSHKEHDAFTVAIVHEWSVPALVRLPDALEKRRHPVASDEVSIQRARTRREMEYLVLDGEVPPPSPKEWEPSANDLQRVSPISIPLSDVNADGANSVPAFETQQPQMYGAESDEDRALREALGPLKQSTIALLLENEDILPQVYDEAQRNGNRIPDGRVVEILEQRRHQQRYGAPVGGGGAYTNSYGAASPYGQLQPSYNDAYNRPPSYQQQQMQAPSMFGKRKAPGAGSFPDAPISTKRKKAAFTLPCIYFPTPGGCKHGNACLYIHDYNALPPTAPGGGNSEYNYHAGGGGGRFGHGQMQQQQHQHQHQQHPGGMRGGGMGGNGMRHIRGGR